MTPSREMLPLDLVIAPGVDAPAALHRISKKLRPEDEYLEPEEKALRWLRSNPEALHRALQVVEHRGDKAGFIRCLNSDAVFREQFFRETIRLLGKKSPVPAVQVEGMDHREKSKTTLVWHRPTMQAIVDYLRGGGTLPVRTDALSLPLEFVGSPEGTAITLQAMLLEEAGWCVSCCQHCSRVYGVGPGGPGGCCQEDRRPAFPSEP